MDIFEALLWVALNIYHEARSEPFIGQKAVAHVVYNRAAKRHLTVKEVVQEPYQFSWVHQKTDYTPTEWGAFLKSAKAAAEAANEPDFTDGATYYHLETVYPSWAPSKVFVAKYGKHLFYREHIIINIRATLKKRKITEGNLWTLDG